MRIAACENIGRTRLVQNALSYRQVIFECHSTPDAGQRAVHTSLISAKTGVMPKACFAYNMDGERIRLQVAHTKVFRRHAFLVWAYTHQTHVHVVTFSEKSRVGQWMTDILSLLLRQVMPKASKKQDKDDMLQGVELA